MDFAHYMPVLPELILAIGALVLLMVGAFSRRAESAGTHGVVAGDRRSGGRRSSPCSSGIGGRRACSRGPSSPTA